MNLKQSGWRKELLRKSLFKFRSKKLSFECLGAFFSTILANWFSQGSTIDINEFIYFCETQKVDSVFMYCGIIYFLAFNNSEFSRNKIDRVFLGLPTVEIRHFYNTVLYSKEKQCDNNINFHLINFFQLIINRQVECLPIAMIMIRPLLQDKTVYENVL